MKRTALVFAGMVLYLVQTVAATAQNVDAVAVNLQANTTSFPHFWEQMFGSGRAVLALRDDYRKDLDEVRSITGFQYVRFHGIFDDDNGVYEEDAQGNPFYNFSYVDNIYDGLLQHGVKPFVEIGFMPKKLAAIPILHPFWYRPSPSPPKDYAKWDALVTAFTRHLVERYGIDEVSRWYFEVWNEPNIDFWAGEPKQSTYWQFYDHTARALKAVSPRLRAGGPATAQAAWADAFIQHVTESQVPADFVSTHVYANDTSQDVFGTHEHIPRDQLVCRAVKKVHAQIKASAKPDLPLIWSEFNASYKNEPEITDSLFMAPWLADTIRQCDGLVDIMSYWTFSDVFDEQGVVKEPFYGGFGLEAEAHLPKPSFNAFKVLHLLGDRRIPLQSQNALATLRQKTLVLAAWNLILPGASGQAMSITFDLQGWKGSQAAKLYRVDSSHGSLLAKYDQMGRPRYPTQPQLNELRQAAQLGPPETKKFKGNQLPVELPPQSLVVIEIE